MDRFLEFTSNNTLLVVGLMVSFFVLVFSELRRKASGLVNIEPVEAVVLMNDNAPVIDLRSADERADARKRFEISMRQAVMEFDALDADESTELDFREFSRLIREREIGVVRHLGARALLAAADASAVV